MMVRLSDNPDGSVRWADPGVDGFGKDAVKAFLQEDPSPPTAARSRPRPCRSCTPLL